MVYAGLKSGLYVTCFQWPLVWLKSTFLIDVQEHSNLSLQDISTNRAMLSFKMFFQNYYYTNKLHQYKAILY